MMRQTRRQRQGSWQWWLTGVLLLVGCGLIVWRFLLPSWFGFVDPGLFDELQNANLDGPVTPTSHQDGQPVAKDWPQWRGPYRDGLSRETGLLKEWPKDLAKLKVWEQPTGVGYSALAVAAGRAYTIVQDRDDEAVVCWDAETGKELWRFRYPCKYENSYGSGPRATPTVEGEVLYAVGATGILHCLKVQSGEKVWRRDLLDDFKAENLRWGVAFSPLIEGDRLFVMPGGPDGNSIAALDKHTGKTLWKALDDPAGYSSPFGATLAGQRQILFFTGAGLVGVTPDTGKLLWRFDWETQYGCNIATPIVAGDYVFISSGYNRGCAVLKIEASGGTFQAKRVYENRKMRNHFSSCVLFKDHLYGFDDSVLSCLEFRTGTVKWKQNGFGKGSLTIADGHLIVLSEQGTLVLAEATPAAYREVSRLTVADEQCWTVPVLANGRLYIRNETRALCLDLRKR
jgi:outer membrane protein assembly factor BamB